MTQEKPSSSTGTPHLTVRLLGRFSVTANDGAAVELPTRKAKALLALMVLDRSGGIERSVAAALLWSRGTETQARTNLRQTLAGIRKALPDGDIIESDASKLSFQTGAVISDLDAVEHAERASLIPYVDTLGPLLDDLQLDEPGFSEWLTAERSSWNRKVTASLFDLAEQLLEDCALDDARAVNLKLIALDAFDEGAHRQTMRILARQGSPAKALKHYEDLRALLDKELGAAPDEATRKLMQSFKASESVAPAQDIGRAHTATGNRKTPITVLPFSQYGTGLDEGFGVSLAEDIAVELSRFTTLRVNRHNLNQDSRKNGYIVEGSLRTSGQRLRVSVQVVNGATGGLVWTDRFETVLHDSFDLLEEIMRRSVATIPGRVQADVAEQATRTSLDALSAHQLMLRGKMLRDTLSASAMLEAREILQRAVSLDGSNARAHMYLSDTYVIDGWLGLGDQATAKQALHNARLAVQADHTDVFVQDHLGFAYLSNAMWDDGRAQIGRTLQKIKHEVESNAWCGYALALLGDHTEALREVEQSTIRDQMPLATFGWIRGQVFSLNGRSEEAIDELRGASSLNSLALAFLAGDYARLGRPHEAGMALSEFIALRRGEMRARDLSVDRNTVNALASGYAAMWRDPGDWQHIATGLDLAGLQK